MRFWRSVTLLPALWLPAAFAGDVPAVVPASGTGAKPEAAKKPRRPLFGGCPIEEVKPEPCPEKKPAPSALPPRTGVDPVENAQKPDARLAGTWDLAPASATPTTGILKIDSAGRFTWTRDGKALSQGDIQEVRPRIGAAEGTRYWKVRDATDDFYVALEEPGLTFYSAGTNSVVATAARK